MKKICCTAALKLFGVATTHNAHMRITGKQLRSTLCVI